MTTAAPLEVPAFRPKASLSGIGLTSITQEVRSVTQPRATVTLTAPQRRGTAVIQGYHRLEHIKEAHFDHWAIAIRAISKE